MAGQGFSWTVQVYLLMLLVRPLDPSSRPERDMGTSGLRPEDLELQDMDPEVAPWLDMALVSWTCFLLELLIMGIGLGWHLGRRLWKRSREEKRRSRSAQAGLRCCCRGRGCPRKLLQLLRHNRALLRLCLRHRPPQRPRAGRAARSALGERRRLRPPSAPGPGSERRIPAPLSTRPGSERRIPAPLSTRARLREEDPGPPQHQGPAQRGGSRPPSAPGPAQRGGSRPPSALTSSPSAVRSLAGMGDQCPAQALRHPHLRS